MTELRTPGIIGTPASADAAAQALQTFREGDERVSLGALTDEAMVALVGDPEQAGPFGPWYRGLDPEEIQLAQMAALRTLTTVDLFAVTGESDDGSTEYVVAPALLAALELRGAEACLIGHRMTAEGPGYWIYRPVDGGLLREIVTHQGYHAFLLTRPDDEERDDLLRWLGAEETAAPDGGAVTVADGDLDDVEKMSFLEGTTRVTTLARQFPGTEGGESTGRVDVVHAGPGKGYIATPAGAEVRYRPAGPSEITELWDEWVAAWR